MASDDNRGKSGSRITDASKQEAGTIEKGKPCGSGASRPERRSEVHEGAAPGAPGAQRPRHPSQRSDLADQIGTRLRGIYDDVLTQPVPDRFLELLRQLESAPGANFARVEKDGT